MSTITEDECNAEMLASSPDHEYTFVNGPKVLNHNRQKAHEPLKSATQNAGAEMSVNSIDTPAFPFVYEPRLPNVCEVVEVASNVLLHVKTESEEFCSGQVSNASFGKQERISRRQTATGTKGAITDWERDFAIQCIADLRLLKEKREDDGRPQSFKCRICSERSFAILNSLLFHYRSHAGMKPYECDVCDATFTRQHSLNYHLLIHNNQSRFVCQDCGREFRHPSHFKEHQRRHTGETPFACMDCSSKFKTRNTYKRHLESRHGKILTAKGISELPRDQSRKPCVPRRKYGLTYLHQNIAAISEYEEAQKNCASPMLTNQHPEATPMYHDQVATTETSAMVRMTSSNKDSFEQLLQAAALAANDFHLLQRE